MGANLPDIDVAAGLWGDDFELHARRGHTHGILAMLVLPLLLAGAIWLWHRWRAPAAADAGVDPGAGAAPFRPRAVLALAFLAVWSHPLLDWLNTYGVRLLMPFDGRWFYGDTLFIVDPWFWLLTAVGVVLARSVSWRAVAGWILLALLASALVLGTGLVPPAVKLTWCAALLALAALRWSRPAWARSAPLARGGMTGLILYGGAVYGMARFAEAAVAARFPEASQVQANPLPGNPFAHRVIVVEEHGYRIVAPDGSVHDVPRQQPDAVVQTALGAASIRGFANWMRFPYWTVEEAQDHWLVRIRDLRYQGPDMASTRDIGFAEVVVPKAATATAAAHQ